MLLRGLFMVTVCLLMGELSAFNLSATSAGLSCGTVGMLVGVLFLSFPSTGVILA